MNSGDKTKIKFDYKFVITILKFDGVYKIVDVTLHNSEVHTTNQASSIFATGRINSLFFSIS